MPDHLGRLAARALGLERTVRPVAPSLFAPGPTLGAATGDEPFLAEPDGPGGSETDRGIVETGNGLGTEPAVTPTRSTVGPPFPPVTADQSGEPAGPSGRRTVERARPPAQATARTEDDRGPAPTYLAHPPQRSVVAVEDHLAAAEPEPASAADGDIVTAAHAARLERDGRGVSSAPRATPQGAAAIGPNQLTRRRSAPRAADDADAVDAAEERGQEAPVAAPRRPDPGRRQGAIHPPRAPLVRLETPAASPTPLARRSARPGALAHDGAPEPPVVQVSIGRIEVRAVTPAGPAPPRPSAPAPAMSLDEYLRSRRGGP